jgi:PAS domain S-box-containing protein
LWITSPPLEVEEAREALQKAVPDLDEYFKKGQIEITSYNNGYLLDGKFDLNRVLQGWVEKEKTALKHSYKGMRVTGNTFWIERERWNSFVDYEEGVNSVIGQHRILVLCTYCLKNCNGTDVMDAVRNHAGTLIKQDTKWSLIEDAAQRKKAKNELQETRDYLENLLNYANAPVIVWDPQFRITLFKLNYANAPVIVWDPQFRITLFNHAFERLTGLNANDVIEKPLEILFPEDKKEEVMAYIKHTFEGEYWETVEIPILDMDGNVKTVLWNSSNIYDPTGKEAIATIAQGNDITERKQVEQALQKAKLDWERTFNSVPDLIVILDNKHEIVRANKAMAQALGITPEQCIGLKCYKYVHGTDKPPDFCPHLKALLDGQEHTAEVHEDALGGDFIVSATPLKDEHGRMIGSVHMARNITARKQMEKKIEEYSKHLELVEERTKQLRDSERLAAIGATAGMVGHDIRNPLQAIIGDTFLAKTDLSSCPESEQKASIQESLSEIEKNVEYINKIVADLQDFAKPLNPIAAMETDLKRIIDDVVSNHRIPENIQASIKVEEGAEKIVADSAYVKRILSNLVNNAVQAMPNGGKLTVQAFCEGENNIITVEDTGVGIPEEAKRKIFTPLFTTKSKGQGFGLAVVKRMTEALGGTVTFDSQVDKGTKFIVRLPKKTNGKQAVK